MVSGPFASRDLVAFAEGGQLLPTDLVWKDGMQEWQTAQSVPWLLPTPPLPPFPPTPFLPVQQAALDFTDGDSPGPTALSRTHTALGVSRQKRFWVVSVLCGLALLGYIISLTPMLDIHSGNSDAKTIAQARKELIDTAKQMEGGMWGAVEYWVVEKERVPDLAWSILDEQFQPGGNFTPETLAAYRKWRAAMIASPPKPRPDSRPPPPPAKRGK